MAGWPAKKEEPDTFEFAPNVGDRHFINFIRERLHLVHGESNQADYMHILKDFEDKINLLVLDAQKWRSMRQNLKEEKK